MLYWYLVTEFRAGRVLGFLVESLVAYGFSAVCLLCRRSEMIAKISVAETS